MAIPKIETNDDYVTSFENNTPQAPEGSTISEIGRSFITPDTGEEVSEYIYTRYEDNSSTFQFMLDNGDIVTYRKAADGSFTKEVDKIDGTVENYTIDSSGKAISQNGDTTIDSSDDSYENVNDAIKVENGNIKIKVDGKELTLEEFMQIYKNLPVNGDGSTADIFDFSDPNKPFHSYEDINNYIRNQINSATNSRDRAVAASLAIMSVCEQMGARIPYSMSGLRQKYTNDLLNPADTQDGTQFNNTLFFDCSSFVAWCLQNSDGLPTSEYKGPNAFTGDIYNWAANNHSLSNLGDIANAQPGDVLVNGHHTMMVVGHDANGNLLCAESNTSGMNDGVDPRGGTHIRTVVPGSSTGNSYYAIDMTNYYNSLDNQASN